MIGAGTMGTGIALAFADAGLPVALVDASDAALARARARIGAYYDGRVAKGRLERGEADARAASIEPRGDFDAVASADVVIEAVGVPATFELAAELVRPVGRLANIGVHGKPVTLHLERLWSRDVTITTGLVDTSSIPTLLKLVASHQIDAERFVTHRFGFDDFIEAYDVFARANETSALKVVLTRNA